MNNLEFWIQKPKNMKFKESVIVSTFLDIRKVTAPLISFHMFKRDKLHKVPALECGSVGRNIH